MVKFLKHNNFQNLTYMVLCKYKNEVYTIIITKGIVGMNEDNESKESLEGKKKLRRLIMIVTGVLLVLVIGVFTYNFFNKNFGEINVAAKETLVEIKTIEDKEEQKQVVKDYDFVHQMSNNLIVAVDGKVWGTQEVTLKNIELGIEMLKDDPYIVEELGKWKEGEFKNVVDVHNYCWRILEGSIGKAKGSSKDGIENALKALGKE